MVDRIDTGPSPYPQRTAAPQDAPSLINQALQDYFKIPSDTNACIADLSNLLNNVQTNNPFAYPATPDDTIATVLQNTTTNAIQYTIAALNQGGSEKVNQELYFIKGLLNPQPTAIQMRIIQICSDTIDRNDIIYLMSTVANSHLNEEVKAMIVLKLGNSIGVCDSHSLVLQLLAEAYGYAGITT